MTHSVACCSIASIVSRLISGISYSCLVVSYESVYQSLVSSFCASNVMRTVVEVKTVGVWESVDNLLHAAELLSLELLSQDGIAFPSVKRKMKDWSKENKKRRETLKTEVMGNELADIAARKMLGKGESFTITADEIAECIVRHPTFNGFTLQAVAKSSSLQAF